MYKNTVSRFKNITVAIDPTSDISIYHINEKYAIMEYNLNTSYKPNSEKGYLFRRVAEESFWVDRNIIKYEGLLPNEVVEFICEKKVYEYDFKETSEIITNIIRNKMFNDDDILETIVSRSLLKFNISRIKTDDNIYYDIMDFTKNNIDKLNISINIVEFINYLLKSATSKRGTIEEYVNEILSAKKIDNLLDNKTIVVKSSKGIKNDIDDLIAKYLNINLNITNLYFLSEVKISPRKTVDNNSKYANIYEISIPVINKYNLSRNSLFNTIKVHVKDTITIARNILISSDYGITEDHLKYMKIDKFVFRNDNTVDISIVYKNDKMQVEV